MARKALFGPRVRTLRSQRGLNQTELAEKLGISVSYLNLIEHNQRPITVPLLIRVAEVLEVALQSFSEDDEARLLSDLREVFSDPVLGVSPPADELRQIASGAPAAGRAVLDLYRAYRRLRDGQAAAQERTSSPALPDDAIAYRLASEEVSDMIQARANYFPAIEAAAEQLRRDARLESGNTYAGLVRHLKQAHGITTEIVPLQAAQGAVRRFDARNRKLLLCEVLPPPSRTFHLSHQIALLGHRATLDNEIAETVFQNPDSAVLGRIALASYFAGATVMPYEEFLAAARGAKHDIDILESRFGASFEQVCHRLTTLQRPGARGIPMHFLRVDLAGNISKRFSASGIQISRFGGACPRWNVHDAFMTPGMIRTQVSRMSDGRGYFCIARTVRKPGGGYRHAQNYLAIGLGCDIEHAREFVYAEAVDLKNPDAFVPIGVSCRICDRMNCRQRAFPPLNHRLVVDENVRGASAYVAPGELI